MRAVVLHLMPEGRAFPGIDDALMNLEGIEREALTNLEWHSDGTYTMIYRLSGTATDELSDLFDQHEDVIEYDILSHSERRIYAFVRTTEREGLSELLSIVEHHGLLLDTPFRFSSEGIRVTVAGSDADLQQAFAKGTDKISIDVESTGTYTPEEPEYLDRMTDRQYEALLTAYELGYYEPDQSVSFEEVAQALGCAPSTANELLRRAEAALVSGVIGD